MSMWIEFDGGNAWFRPDGSTVVRVKPVPTSQGVAEWAVKDGGGSFLDACGQPVIRQAIIFTDAVRAMDWLDRINPVEFVFSEGRFAKAAA